MRLWRRAAGLECPWGPTFPERGDQVKVQVKTVGDESDGLVGQRYFAGYPEVTINILMTINA